MVLVFVIVTFLAYLTVDEFNPSDVENVEISGKKGDEIETGKSFTMMSWNIGYGALGDNADFFMDGGKMVYSADRARAEENLNGISQVISENDPDILLLQEVDRNSSRSYFMDELEALNTEEIDIFDYQSSFAPNLKVSFIPMPIPPIGKVLAGLGTVSKYQVSAAERIQLPVPYKWPLSTINLKRCLEVSHLPVKGSDKELVLVNLHLEAYDSGEGKIAQTKMLRELLLGEIEKGNYVIAGGDFNQVFSNVDTSAYPQLDVDWVPGYIDVTEFGNDLTFVSDSTYPTCRSLDKPLATAENKDPQHFQYYMLDGFIVSSNVTVHNVETLNKGFVCSDHNPVILRFKLK